MNNHRLIHHPQAIRQTQTHLLHSAENAGDICHCLHAVIHDMITTTRRSGRFPINLRSQGGRQAPSKLRLRFFWPLYFLLKHLKHLSSFFFYFPSPSLRICLVMFIKRKSIFKALPAPQNWLRTRVETRGAFILANYRQASARPSRADECKSGLFPAVCFTLGEECNL